MSVQDLLVSRDGLLAPVGPDDGEGAGMEVVEAERSGAAVVGLGLVGAVEPTQAARRDQGRASAGGPAREVAAGEVEGGLQVAAPVGRLGLPQWLGVQLSP